MKKILAIILVLAALMSLTACGSLDENGVYYIVDAWSDNPKQLKTMLKQTQRTLDPRQIYDSITYNEKMFYGEYKVENWEKNREAFMETATFAELDYCVTYLTNESEMSTGTLSTLPMGITAGHPCVYNLRNNLDHEWACLQLVNEHGGVVDVLCSYTVQGKQITFTPLDSYTDIRDEEYKRLGVEYVLGEDSLTYTFSFSGVALTLSNETGSVTLVADEFSNNGSTAIDLGGYLAEGSASLGGMDWLSASLGKKYESIYVVHQDDERWIDEEAIAFAPDGWMVMYWQETDEEGNMTEFTKELVYFPGDGNVMVLTDGVNIYYYTDNYATHEMGILKYMVAEEDKDQLAQLEENQIKQIAEKKANLLADLAAAYEAAGLKVSINEQTGEIAMDSTVLFGANESKISGDGEAFLQQFMQVYTGVVFSEKYTDFVSKIMVEGHTDTRGDYDMNLELSQARADSVRDYCLSEQCGVDEAYMAALNEMMQSVGYSYDKPVYDANGEVDMDASRRVSFRFVINLG